MRGHFKGNGNYDSYKVYKAPRVNNSLERSMSVTMNTDLWLRFDDIGRRQNRSKAVIVRELVEKYLAEVETEKELESA